MSRASLAAEHQPRTLRAKGLGPAYGEPQRISCADEAAITKQVRAAEDAAVIRTREDVARNLARLGDEVRTELLRLRDPRVRPTRQSSRDLGNAVVMIGKVCRALSPIS